MPTIISHAVVPFALRCWLGRAPLPASVVAAGAAGAILPDRDVIGFALHVPYASTFGHRGFTHSIVFALLAALVLRRDRRTFAFVLLWREEPAAVAERREEGHAWRPIEVSPIGRFDAGVFLSELKWVWLPAIVAAVMARIPQSIERHGRRGSEDSGEGSAGTGRR